ncbi:(2Fe-2S)-binding protein [Bacillus sp. OK048]|uniref:(2Fe-2S)-binding protein n=1 Tax=Bacillus sp. OK048 TaxID=1882761 RepID=UPI0008903FFB|nr:(2Fe-2S)-binding protein [Bacillus sp. OK048]SDL87849.1 carbon-monoxide dehydrogenase small subunit [Bacillus sp. OK048]
MSNKVQVGITINGKEVQKEVEPRLLLTDFIRDECNLTGTHLGCEHGVCGACTILLDNEPVRGCLMFAVQADGSVIQTVESLKNVDGTLNVLQQSFSDHHALQCGFCTPGFLMTLTHFLEDNQNPSEKEIREAISGNLCRCTGYANIIKAVQQAAITLQSENTNRSVISAQ